MKKLFRSPGMKAFSDTIKGLMLFLMLLGIASPVPGKAESGMPDSPKFGYGARIDPWGQEIETALNAASEARLDWIGIDFDWGRHWPDLNSSLNLAGLSRVMSYASDHDLMVLISIIHAPSWALTPQGPDPDLTAGLVAQLSRLYPDTLLAVELFPSANTVRGWGAVPDPEAYSELLKVTGRTLENAGRPTVLVAAGLEPVLTGGSSQVGSSRQDMDDLLFLQRLYDAGAGNYLPIIGVRIPQTAQAPLAPPWKADPRVLRHYESVRGIMLSNHHSEGRIWITGFSMPGEQPADINSASKSMPSKANPAVNEQVRWFNQAMSLMKSQLYIGAVFYGCMNPTAKDIPGKMDHTCFIGVDNPNVKFHPAFQSLEQIISLEKSGTLNTTAFEKRSFPIDSKNLLKASAP